MPHLLHRKRLDSPRRTLTRPRCPHPHFSSITVGSTRTGPRYDANAAAASSRNSALLGCGSPSASSRMTAASARRVACVASRFRHFDQSRPTTSLLSPPSGQALRSHALPIDVSTLAPIPHQVPRHAGVLCRFGQREQPGCHQRDYDSTGFSVLFHLPNGKQHFSTERDALNRRAPAQRPAPQRHHLGALRSARHAHQSPRASRIAPAPNPSTKRSATSAQRGRSKLGAQARRRASNERSANE
jgi:hypothetical protein